MLYAGMSLTDTIKSLLADPLFLSYARLGVAALLPVLASILFFLLEKKTPFRKVPNWVRQAFIGIVFGGIAIIGTEWGIPMEGAKVNCRDAAPLCAGLLFGGPAGIIAGLIGGVERWLAAAWGAGEFTKIACSVSTALAGLYAALLRRYMFDEKKPGWLLALAIGVVMEVFHLTMVFLTNLSEAERAAAVVRVCAIPMISANGVSVMLATMAVTLFSGELSFRKREKVGISQSIQKGLMICVLLTFVLTSVLVYSLQNNVSDIDTRSMLTVSIEDVEANVDEAADRTLLVLADRVRKNLEGNDLQALADTIGVSEINLVNENGVITKSTNPEFVGFDMHSGEQSAEFLVLLDGEEYFVQDYRPLTFNRSISRKYAAAALEKGFVQVGFDARRFQQEIDTQVLDATHNYHVGETGFILIADNTGDLVSGPDKYLGHTLSELSLAMTLRKNPAGAIFRQDIAGDDCFCMYRTSEGYTFIAARPVAEAHRTRDLVLYVNSFMEILAFGAMFLVIYLLIKKLVVNNIHNINLSLSRITNGDLDVTVDVRSNREFASLSDDINATVNRLKQNIAEAAARIDKELEFARSIQESSLPAVSSAFCDREVFDIHAAMVTAKEVGGDFYDFFMVGDVLYFLVADVSGKGIPAAMFMMRAKTQLRSLAESGLPIEEVFAQGNDHLCTGNDAGMFVTAWMGALDLNTGHMTYANAGHNPPLLRKTDGTVQYMTERSGLVLAGMDGLPYRRLETDLQPGDTLFLYTDGVTEATDANQELFGEDRLERALNEAKEKDVRELCELVKERVDAFVGEAPQFDDITMLSVQYKKPLPSIHFDHAAIADIPAVTEFVEQELEKLDCPMKITMKFSISVDEIYSNIVKFAYGKGTGPATVYVKSDKNHEGVSLIFEDEGKPYDPLSREDPDVTLSAEERGIGGLGIFMVKNFMDDVKYQYIDNKNILRLYKRFE